MFRETHCPVCKAEVLLVVTEPSVRLSKPIQFVDEAPVEPHENHPLESDTNRNSQALQA